MFRSPRLQISALAAIGKRLPYPNALAEIFYTRRGLLALVSLRSTMRTTRRTRRCRTLFPRRSLRRMGILNVVIQNYRRDFIGGQRITIFLSGSHSADGGFSKLD